MQNARIVKNLINTRQTIDFSKFKRDFKLHRNRIAVIRKYLPIENKPKNVLNKTANGCDGLSGAVRHLSKISENNHEHYDSLSHKIPIQLQTM